MTLLANIPSPDSGTIDAGPFTIHLYGLMLLLAIASAVALTERVSADLAYRNGVAIVTMAEGGLMYEASVGGQKLSFHPTAKGA